MQAEWVEKEMQAVSFGDKRLDERAKTVLQALGAKPTGSIPMASGGWSETKAAYRFFGNDKVGSEKILSAHQCATLDRMNAYDIILCPQDTTEIHYSGHKSAKEIGILRSEKDYGLILHSTIAITPERLVLGVIDAQFLYREELKKEETRKQLSIEEKESYKWLRSYEKVQGLAKLHPEKTLISIADREGDIYEFLSQTPNIEQNNAQWIIRSAQDRKIIQDEIGNKKLWEQMSSAPVLGEINFKFKQDNNEIRSVTQELRVKEIELCAPYRKGKRLENSKVYAVLATEINNSKEPIEWLLLTSIKVENFEQAVLIAQYYCARWEIEIFFKVLKGGCLIEELQLEKRSTLESCLAIYMIVAWRVLYIMMLGRECPDIPADIIFHEYEWKSAFRAVKKKVPTEIPTLGEMVKVIAVLGGYLDRNADGPPGCKVMWIGLQRIKDIAFGWEMAHDETVALL